MDNTALITGIIAGIIVSVIIWIAIRLFNNVIIPWYLKTTFNGPNINGVWIHSDSHYEEGILYSYEDKLTIIQKGNKITGIYSCRNERHGEVLVTEYDLFGSLQDSFVLINYRRRNNTGTGIGSFLLKVVGNGDILRGGVSFIELKTSEVVNYGGVNFRKQ